MFPALFGGGGSITEESVDEAYAVNEELVSEGVTLLENNGALPVSELLSRFLDR